ncbi:MAG: diacylglycerol kinase family protein [Sulfurovum sp.]|nr:diacylglycerol kinase family protein [Sulfurovum sp.]
MQILSIGKEIRHTGLDITSIDISEITRVHDIEQYDYVIITGGDGRIRRTLQQLHDMERIPTFILNPTGSFNLVARIHQTPKVEEVLDLLARGETPGKEKHHLFKLNEELFLFSAGNMGDLQHIILSETLRFGWIEHGALKYLLAVLLLLPAHILLTPFMLMSPRKFFIFTPLRFIRRFGSFCGEVREMTIDLQNHHNLIELDGDVVTIEENLLHIRPVGYIEVVTK